MVVFKKDHFLRGIFFAKNRFTALDKGYPLIVFITVILAVLTFIDPGIDGIDKGIGNAPGDIPVAAGEYAREPRHGGADSESIFYFENDFTPDVGKPVDFQVGIVG